MDQRLVEAVTRAFADLEAVQAEVLRLLDRGDEAPAELRDRLRSAEAAHDEAQAAFERHIRDR